MRLFMLPVALLLLSVIFYVAENLSDRPSMFRAAIYVIAVIESVLCLSITLETI